MSVFLWYQLTQVVLDKRPLNRLLLLLLLLLFGESLQPITAESYLSVPKCDKVMRFQANQLHTVLVCSKNAGWY